MKLPNLECARVRNKNEVKYYEADVIKDMSFAYVIIDEASQCDIASIIPLLFRAKRAVIIGDPKQLQHISQLSSKQDLALLNKYHIDPMWSYSANSLYALAAGKVEQPSGQSDSLPASPCAPHLCKIGGRTEISENAGRSEQDLPPGRHDPAGMVERIRRCLLPRTALLVPESPSGRPQRTA